MQLLRPDSIPEMPARMRLSQMNPGVNALNAVKGSDFSFKKGSLRILGVLTSQSQLRVQIKDEDEDDSGNDSDDEETSGAIKKTRLSKYRQDNNFIDRKALSREDAEKSYEEKVAGLTEKANKQEEEIVSLNSLVLFITYTLSNLIEEDC